MLISWVLLHDHWHAVLYPPHPLTISKVMESIKVSSTKQINGMGGKPGGAVAGPLFRPALRTVKEYQETLEHIHWNPVKAGLAPLPEAWPWSSVHDFVGNAVQPTGAKTLVVDRIELPLDRR